MVRFVAILFCAGCVLASTPGQGASQDQPKAQGNAPKADRDIAAEFIREALATELTKIKLSGSANNERHKIEKRIRIDFPRIEKTIVTYWRSDVSADASVPEPNKRVAVEIPTMVGNDNALAITVSASAPLEGRVSGQALTDDRKISTGAVKSRFTCTLTVAAECTVKFVRQGGKESIQIEVRSWTPAVKNLRFDNAILDALRSEVNKVANDKLSSDSEKLRATLNSALQKAYADGKLKLTVGGVATIRNLTFEGAMNRIARHGAYGAVCFAALFARAAAAADPTPLDLAGAGEYVQDRLYRAESRGAEPRIGTAYLLRVDDKTGVAHFATCYHVLHQQKQLRLYAANDQSGDPLVSFEVGAGEAYVVPQLDLVLLRVPLPKAKAMVRALPPAADEGWQDDGFVFGFPVFQSSEPFPVEVRVTKGRQAAAHLQFLANRSDAEMNVRFLGKQITYPGMSGGPVVTTKRRYAGMLLGRMPEPAAIPVILPAEQIIKRLEDADADKLWKPFAPTLFAAALPYATQFRSQLNVPYLVEDMDWSSFEQWAHILDSDPKPFLRDFLEVPVRLDVLRGVQGVPRRKELALTFEVGPGSTPAGQPDGRHAVQFRWNGRDWKPGDPAPLRPGENLLIITKADESGGALVVNDLFRPNPLEVDLLLGGTQVLRIRRSLPSLVRRYAVFVTIHNGSIVDVAERDPYTARLAVRLDHLADLVNRVPFRLPVAGQDPRSGSEYVAAATSHQQYLKLIYASPQTVDVELQSHLTVERASAKFGGIRITYPPDAALRRHDADTCVLAAAGGGAVAARRPPSHVYPLTVGGRLQFPYEEPAAAGPDGTFFFASPRAHGASSSEPFRLPVFGNDVDVDVGPLLREALVCYVNKELLIPNKAAIPGPEHLRNLLAQAGVMSALGGHTLHPLRMFLKKDARGRPWVVITFHLVEAATGRPVIPNGVARGDRPPLLPTGDSDGIGVEFEAVKLPLAASRTHLTRPIRADGANRLACELTDVARAGVWADKFRFHAPIGPAGPRLDTPVVLDPKAEGLGAGVGGMLRATFRETPKSFEATLAPDAPLRLLAEFPALKAVAEAKPIATGGFRMIADTGPKQSVLKLLAPAEGYSATLGGEMKFAKGFTANKVAFVISKAALTTDLTTSGFTGLIEGTLTADQVLVGGDTFTGVTITFKAEIDSTRKDTEQVKLCLTVQAKEWIRPNKKQLVLARKAVKLDLGTASAVENLSATVISQLLKAIAGKPDC